MSELATKVIALVGGDIPIEYHPLPSDDPTQRQPTISKAKELLGWSPKIELAEGLAATVEYFRKHLEVGAAAR
jgi:UDP-glucuronate decarboxylase